MVINLCGCDVQKEIIYNAKFQFDEQITPQTKAAVQCEPWLFCAIRYILKTTAPVVSAVVFVSASGRADAFYREF